LQNTHKNAYGYQKGQQCNGQKKKGQINNDLQNNTHTPKD